MNGPLDIRRRKPQPGLTLLEILVVLVILSLLATMAVGVYTKEIVRARYAKARADIASLSIAVNRYYSDLGTYPPGGSRTPALTSDGSGLLQLALRSSMSGDMNNPASPRWQGPYIEWDYRQFSEADGAPIDTSTDLGDRSFRDPFGQPYAYVNFRDYSGLDGTELPASNPFAANETYYNPSSFQIISFGVDGVTLPSPSRGLDTDDVTNFQGSGF
ncbi:MAG: prepilin-type N-terminal cleavage/methylation domain-containing protein [Candidatus Sumerlaeia bacterium]|nr:prepilin-type N-terminal cleavage/methylation domain-containing protein [Candidatus Sumerlaeia bacterium]